MLQGRSSGILLPVFSLPGPYGIGTLGEGARRFVDFLSQARQHTWQILPLVPPGSGDSPYMSPSAFAGNPWLLDLEDLHQRGLLTAEELSAARYPARGLAPGPGDRRPGGLSGPGGPLAPGLRPLPGHPRPAGPPPGPVAGGAPPPGPRRPGPGPERAGGGGGLPGLPPVPLFPPVGRPEGLRQPEGRGHHGGPAHLCLGRQRRGLGPAPALPDGRGLRPLRRGRGAA